jgi:hypothetical protein
MILDLRGTGSTQWEQNAANPRRDYRWEQAVPGAGFATQTLNCRLSHRGSAEAMQSTIEA